MRSSEARFQQEASARIAGLKHRTAQLTDGQLHYVEAGAGEPLVLIHGGHGSWTHWIANIGALARTRRVIAIDLPGFGGSYQPRPDYTVAQYADIVLEMLSTMDIGPTALAGFSFGCMVATAAARHEPQRVTHVVLVNAPGIGPASPAAAALMKSLTELSLRKGLAFGTVESLRRIQLFDQRLIDRPLVERILVDLRHTKFVTRNLSNAAHTQDLLADLRQPTLIFIGREDVHRRFGLAGALREIARHAPHAQLWLVERAAHWLQYERADLFNEVVADFLR